LLEPLALGLHIRHCPSVKYAVAEDKQLEPVEEKANRYKGCQELDPSKLQHLDHLGPARSSRKGTPSDNCTSMQQALGAVKHKEKTGLHGLLT